MIGRWRFQNLPPDQPKRHTIHLPIGCRPYLRSTPLSLLSLSLPLSPILSDRSYIRHPIISLFSSRTSPKTSLKSQKKNPDESHKIPIKTLSNPYKIPMEISIFQWPPRLKGSLGLKILGGASAKRRAPTRNAWAYRNFVAGT